MASNAHFISPATAPSSPAATRRNAPPVTPQRLSQSARHSRSPLTPASNLSTPYTPLSLRSFASSNSSGITTPQSASSIRKHGASASLSYMPDFSRVNDKSLADIAENWRSRASENGIRVGSADDMYYPADDEASEATRSGTTSPVYRDDGYARLTENNTGVPFLSQRRPRAQTFAAPLQRGVPMSPQNQPPLQLSLSPQAVRTTPARRTLASNNLNLNTPPRKAATAKEIKLKGSLTDPAHTRRRPSFGQTTDLFDIDENEYAPYPQAFDSPAPERFPLSLHDPFEPFPALPTISESDFHSIHSQAASGCSVCGRTASSLAILSPCSHPLCSACLTSALNIVGEKDMACAVCHQSVDDFHLQAAGTPTNPAGNPFAPNALLPSAFDSGDLNMGQFKFFELARDASTPVPGPKAGENVVLRIDNVPWDITPPAIVAWLRQPVVLVHVLLDRKGKTLSHAFVELANEEIAKAALRGAQNSVLGRGRRARGVTVTRSGQEELMRALFPSWQGNFDSSKPSLNGLPHERVIKTLETGLISETEFDALLHLIRSPDSHFLKVPELPFHSLISILAKFPADIDSRVFWSCALRDMLYDVTFAAIQVLLSRIHGPNASGPGDYSDLLSQLVHAGLNCRAFTTQQINKLAGHCQVAEPRRSPPPLESLAREFGVGPELIQALAQRLSAM